MVGAFEQSFRCWIAPHVGLLPAAQAATLQPTVLQSRRTMMFAVPAAHGCGRCAPSRWVRSLAFDPSNEWFCTGSADRTIKIWDVATGQLKLTLTGHIEQAGLPRCQSWPQHIFP